MPLVQTRGAASAQGFGEFAQAAVAANYIEDVFQTWLYTGNGSTQTITNGIDLSTKGGLVWIKDRTTGGTSYEHALTDTVRGATNEIQSDTTAAQTTNAARLTSFNSNGFSIGNSVRYNNNNDNYASWTFRKQPKFFDVVTWTGSGANRTISHSLGSVPACIIVKRTDTTAAWAVYHRSLANTEYLVLNTTAAKATGATWWNSTTPTSAVFSLGTDASVNASGGTYVAYIYAHDAGGFGLTGTDNVISCGSYVGNGGVLNVNIGYEPQWLLIKQATGSGGNWSLVDNMRGVPVLPSYASYLAPNTLDAETVGLGVHFNATGFNVDGFGLDGSNGETYIYIAIRRGPMKVPTSGTSVFNTVLWTGNSTNNRQITGVGFNPDFVEAGTRSAATTFDRVVVDRLRGTSPYLATYATQIEQSNSDLVSFDNDGITVDYVSSGAFNNNSNIYGHFFKRAPSFFDEVCYTGTGAAMTVSHNLGAVPELIILKSRNNAESWMVYAAPLGNAQWLALNSSSGASSAGLRWNDTTPTSSVFSVGKFSGTTPYSSGSDYTYVAYLFATCAGVSKVGSYTGTGTTLQIDCGFTGGARFVLIKRTDSTGDWYVWDTARGIVSGNDPYLLLNSTAVEVTNTDYIDTYSAGFEISSTAPAAINSNGGSFIFLAIA